MGFGEGIDHKDNGKIREQEGPKYEEVGRQTYYKL